MTAHSLTALKRWSCINTQLPNIDTIRSIQVYDFDNTLFHSPLPNPQLWNSSAVGLLRNDNVFKNGGWWQDPGVLSCTGEGLEKEEPRAWEGWWNETLVELVEMAMKQSTAFTVLLTGRSERGFSELIPRIMKSKSLVFDMIVLKPEVGPSNERFSSTLLFKKAFLEQLLATYPKIEEVKIYEDRPKHAEKFEVFLKDQGRRILQNSSENGPRLQLDVINVAPGSKTLDPLTEASQVQTMVHHHNLAVRSDETFPGSSQFLSVKSQVLFSGYLISPEDTERLVAIANLPEEGLFTLANSVMISSRPLTAALHEKIGGIGTRLRWKVTALGMYENKVWAARVEPVPVTEPFYVDSPVPMVVLARRATAKPSDAWRIQNWSLIPPEKQIEFDSVVGEKVLLRLDQHARPHKAQYRPSQQSSRESNRGSLRGNVHRRPDTPGGPRSNENRPLRTPSGGQQHVRGGYLSRGGRPTGPRGGKGQTRTGHGSSRGGRRGGHNAPYRSLDDNPPRGPPRFGFDGTNEDAGLTY